MIVRMVKGSRVALVILCLMYGRLFFMIDRCVFVLIESAVYP